MLDIKYVKDHKTGNIVYPIIKSEGIVDAFNINRTQINYLFGEVASFSIKEDTSNIRIKEGDSITLTINLQTKGEIDYSDIKWSSSDSNVVTVNNGTITAVGNGSATITVSSRLYNVQIEIPIKVGNEDMSRYWSITYKSPIEVPHILEQVPEEIRKACKYHYDGCVLFLSPVASLPYTTYVGSDYDPSTQFGHWYFTTPFVCSYTMASKAPITPDGLDDSMDVLIYSFTTCTYQANSETTLSWTLDVSPITEIYFGEGAQSTQLSFSTSEFNDLQYIGLPETWRDLSFYINFDFFCDMFLYHPRVAQAYNYLFTAGKNITTINANMMTSGSESYGPSGDLRHFKYLSVHPVNPVFDSREDCNAIIKTADNTLVVGCTNTVIPSSVTGLAEGAFSGVQIESIEIPSHITTMGIGAFEGSTLTSVTVNCPIISSCCFRNCSRLTNVVISNNIVLIGDAAFPQQLSEITFLGTTSEWEGRAESFPSDWCYDDGSSQTRALTIHCIDGDITYE